MAAPSSLKSLAVPLTIEPMEAKLVTELPEEKGWQFEPKWDGFRCLAFRAGKEVDLRAKSGKPLARYFPEVVAMLGALKPKQFVLDGELAIPLDNTLSFDALQMRIHPAESRINKLAAETPAIFILFDMLLDAKGKSLIDAPLTTRREALEAFYNAAGETKRLKLSPYTLDRKKAEAWLDDARGALDGVVAKRSDDPYLPGTRAMLKVKHLRTADCVVGGFRYETGSREVGSMLLGLYNKDGKLDHVGFTSTISDKERPALTKQLEGLIAPPGFTGNAPGGTSRWSTERSGEWEPVEPKIVVEVRYDHVTGDRFRHGTKLIRFRPDKAPRQCTFDQIEPEALPTSIKLLLK
jgi:ATP-dependent DNA ligase